MRRRVPGSSASPPTGPSSARASGSPPSGSAAMRTVDGSGTLMTPGRPYSTVAHMRWARSAAPSTIHGWAARNSAPTSGISVAKAASIRAARSATPARDWTASSPGWNRGTGSEEAAGRGGAARRGAVDTGAGEDLQPHPVGVLEEDPTAGGALAVGDDAVVVEVQPRRADPLLGGRDGLERVDLEGEVVQPGPVGGERALALAPEREDQPDVIPQEGIAIAAALHGPAEDAGVEAD